MTYTIEFPNYAAAERFVEAKGLPFAAIEVAAVKWVNNSPKATYAVRVPA